MTDKKLFEGMYDEHPEHPETAPRDLTDKDYAIRSVTPNDAEGGVVETWHKLPGDRVSRGDVLATVRFDPGDAIAVHELNHFFSPVDGVLREVFTADGASYNHGTTLGRVSYDLTEHLNHDPLAQPIADHTGRAWTPRSLHEFVSLELRNKPGRDAQREKELDLEAKRLEEEKNRRQSDVKSRLLREREGIERKLAALEKGIGELEDEHSQLWRLRHAADKKWSFLDWTFKLYLPLALLVVVRFVLSWLFDEVQAFFIGLVVGGLASGVYFLWLSWHDSGELGDYMWYNTDRYATERTRKHEVVELKIAKRKEQSQIKSDLMEINKKIDTC